MPIITVANQKGGCGKTTVSIHLAAGFVRRGMKTALIDGDPQATATRWAASAPDERPFPADVIGLAAAGGKIHREIQKYIDRYGVIIVDCPPAVDSPTPQSALLVSDLAIIPIIPSPPDIWASVGIQALIEQAKVVNENLEARALLNQYDGRRVLSNEAKDALAEIELTHLDAYFGHREAYRQAGVIGGSVYDLKADTAMQEVERLIDEIARMTGIK